MEALSRLGQYPRPGVVFQVAVPPRGSGVSGPRLRPRLWHCRPQFESFCGHVRGCGTEPGSLALSNPLKTLRTRCELSSESTPTPRTHRNIQSHLPSPSQKPLTSQPSRARKANHLGPSLFATLHTAAPNLVSLEPRQRSARTTHPLATFPSSLARPRRDPLLRLQAAVSNAGRPLRP